MASPRVIEVRESLLADNSRVAVRLRETLAARRCFAVNVMGSPGAGKTSLILASIAGLQSEYSMAVIEADLDSSVDAELIEASGHRAVQLHTGGFCHLDATMTAQGFAALGYPDLTGQDAGGEAAVGPVGPVVASAARAQPPEPHYDLVFVENVGNLICTAQVDAGAHLDVALLSLPEGDDKPLKYPVMFRAADLVLVTKNDFAAVQPFDIGAFSQSVRRLNPTAPVMALSARTGEGMDAWLGFLRNLLVASLRPAS